MDISKHKVLEDIHDACLMVERLGASPELTDLVIKLADIGNEVEKIIDDKRGE